LWSELKGDGILAERRKMKTLFIGWQEVTRFLTMGACIGVMRETFLALARGKAVQPLRRSLPLPNGTGLLGMMPAYLESPPVVGLKAISFFPENQGTSFESHQGAILLFETENGRMLGAVDASSVTAIRTAAASGVATDLLARKDVRDLTILGSGTQASTHLDAMLAVRNGIRRVRVWSRNPSHAGDFAKRHSNRTGVMVEAVADSEKAVAGADLVCTTTAAKSPVLRGAWLAAGSHVNAVGASVPPFRELDSEAVARSRFFVDRRESALNEADDFRIPKKEGLIDDSHIAGEVGEVLLGTVVGRRNDQEVTIFKSLGLAVEDLAAAFYIYKQASEAGAGTWVEFSPERHVDPHG
jgi:ornithine cyclodeaminase/alanine dehydrogenase-like protein (mu-crystallin family)